MERKEFIRSCGYACLGGAALVAFLESCSSTKQLNAPITGNDLVVPLKKFESRKGDKTAYKKYIIVHNDALLFPICIYRFNENEYTALWMQCTHQGATLQAFGDKLQCPAHGSEFGNRGEVEGGPALSPLRKFPVTIEKDQLKISLKAAS